MSFPIYPVHIWRFTSCCSLDCRHVCCGPCLVEWFNAQHSTTCPVCRVESRGQPQRDFALSGVLSKIYEAQGRAAPTPLSENFNTSIFANIYAEKEEREQRVREQRERTQLVNGVIAQTQTVNTVPGAVFDADM